MIIGEDIVLNGNVGGGLSIVQNGLVQLVTPDYAILDTLASSQDDAYTGLLITIGGQSREIVAYDGETRTARFATALSGILPAAGAAYSINGLRSRSSGRIVVDPGVVAKLQSTRIEAEMGSLFIAEGTRQRPIVFTSIADDSYGGSGSFDTSNDRSTNSPRPGDWAGIYFAATSRGSIDDARFLYGGGRSDIEGFSALFNVIEIVQANVRISDSQFRFNNALQFNNNRNGRGVVTPATISVRGAQPTILNNIFQDNAGPAISINANAMSRNLQGDSGRSTGFAERDINFDDNYGRWSARTSCRTTTATECLFEEPSFKPKRSGTIPTSSIFSSTKSSSQSPHLQRTAHPKQPRCQPRRQARHLVSLPRTGGDHRFRHRSRHRRPDWRHAPHPRDVEVPRHPDQSCRRHRWRWTRLARKDGP